MNFMLQQFKHPLWLVGFRPLFALGMVSGMLLPMLWYLMYSHRIAFDSSITPLQWHVHEMYFGFGWAVLGGFLLTASKNWAGVRGHHGWVLALVCLFWLLDRLAFWLPVGLPQIVPLLLHNAFLLLIVPLILWTLLNALDKIGKDNWYFILGLPLFVVSKNLLFTDPYFELGWTMSQGLFRLAVAMMLERTVFQFMKMSYQVEIAQIKWLDASIRLGLFVAVYEVLLPLPVAIAVMAITASLLLYRFMLWHPMKGMRKQDTGVMYVAYLGLLTSLYLECLRLLGVLHVVGDVATHVFTLLSMGLVMAAMMIRISQGHTARNIVFTESDKAAIWLAGLGGVVRIVFPQIWPQQYEHFVLFAAFSWEICFLVLGWRLIPFLFKPRLDGKES
jgi:uncharacterized protein involved in response to NO